MRSNQMISPFKNIDMSATVGYTLLGSIVCFAVLSSRPLLMLMVSMVFLSLFSFNRSNIVHLVFLVLPVTILPGFIDVPVLRVPSLETTAGIYLNILTFSCILMALQRHFKEYELSLLKVFSPFFVVLMLSTLLSTNVYRSFGFMLKTYVPLSFFLILYLHVLKSERNKVIFEKYFALTYFVVFVVALSQYLNNGLGFTEGFRAHENIVELKNLGENLRVPSLFKHTYAFVEFNMFVFPFVYVKFLSTSDSKKRLAILCFIFMILSTTIWTQQRTGLAVIILQFVILYIFKTGNITLRQVIPNMIKITVILALITLVIYKTEYGEALVTRILNTFINPQELTRDIGSTLQRVWRIQISWEIFKAYPILGSGLATSPELFVKFGWDYVNAAGGPHNLYLLLLSETGLLGFITFLFAWVSIIMKIYPFVKGANLEMLGVLVFLVTVLINGLFTGLLSGASIIVFAIVLGYAYSLIPSHTKVISDATT